MPDRSRRWQDLLEAPEEVVALLLRGRGLEGVDDHSAGVHAGHHVLDGAVLAAGVHALHGDQDRSLLLGPEPGLKIEQLRMLLDELFEGLLLADPLRLIGAEVDQVDPRALPRLGAKQVAHGGFGHSKEDSD